MKIFYFKVKQFFKGLWHGLKALIKATLTLCHRGRYNELRCYRCCYRKSGDPKKLEYCKKQWKGSKRVCERFRYDATSIYERVKLFGY